jgi:S1-C subfamily serine protease
MNNSDTKIAILKTLWGRLEDGRWGIRAAKSLALKPQNGFDLDFFKFESEMELFNCGSRNIHEMFASFGPTDFLMKQSLLPVVAWVENEDVLRCIGTAFVISCTGYVITACHVLLDPKERNYGKVVREGNILKSMGNLHMGV